jgi:hypothetical protein
MLRDVAFSGDTNVIKPLNAKLNPICHLLALLGAHHILHVSRIKVKKEAEKFLKYKNFTIEVQHMWNVKIKVIPIKRNRRDWDHFKVI